MKRVLALARGWLAFGILGTAMMYSTCLADTELSQPALSGGGGVSSIGSETGQTVGGTVGDGTIQGPATQSNLSADGNRKFAVIWGNGNESDPFPDPYCPLYSGSEQWVQVVEIGPDNEYSPYPANVTFEWLGGYGDCTTEGNAGVIPTGRTLNVRSSYSGIFYPVVRIKSTIPEQAAVIEWSQKGIYFEKPYFEDFGYVRPVNEDGTTLAQFDTLEDVCKASIVSDGGWIHRDSRLSPITLRGIGNTVGTNPEAGAACTECARIGLHDYQEDVPVPQESGKYDFTFPLLDPQEEYNTTRVDCDSEHDVSVLAESMVRHDRHCTVYQVGVDQWFLPKAPSDENDASVFVGVQLNPPDIVLCSDCVGVSPVATMRIEDVHASSYWVSFSLNNGLSYSKGMMSANWDGRLFLNGNTTSSFIYSGPLGYRVSDASIVLKDSYQEHQSPVLMSFSSPEFYAQTSIGAGTTVLAGEEVEFSIIGGEDWQGFSFTANWSYQDSQIALPAHGKASTLNQLTWTYFAPSISTHQLYEPLHCTLSIYDPSDTLVETYTLETYTQVLFRFQTASKTDNYANNGGVGDSTLPNWVNHYAENRDAALEIIRLNEDYEFGPDTIVQLLYPGNGAYTNENFNISPAIAKIGVDDIYSGNGPYHWSNPAASFLDASGQPFSVPAGQISINIPQIKGVDELQWYAYHELEHILQTARWRNGAEWYGLYGIHNDDPGDPNCNDHDSDWLPDEYEVTYGLDPHSSQSYADFYHNVPGNGDIEIMADFIAQDHIMGNAGSDWGFPGLQSYPGIYSSNNFMGTAFHGRPSYFEEY